MPGIGGSTLNPNTSGAAGFWQPGQTFTQGMLDQLSASPSWRHNLMGEGADVGATIPDANGPGGLGLIATILGGLLAAGALPGMFGGGAAPGGAGGGAAGAGGAATGGGIGGATGAAMDALIPTLEGFAVTAPAAGASLVAPAIAGGAAAAAPFLNSGTVPGFEVVGQSPGGFNPAPALPFAGGLAPSTQPLMQETISQPSQSFTGEPGGGGDWLNRVLDMMPAGGAQRPATGQSGAPAAPPPNTGTPFGGGGPGAAPPPGLSIRGSTAPDIFPWRR